MEPGYCYCGCGQRTTINEQTKIRDGYKKGEYRKYVRGHRFKNIHAINYKNGLGGYGKNHGYKYVYNPEHPKASKRGEVAEALMVIEYHLGKYLSKGAIIHHVDGNKLNNNPSNLMVCENRGYHRVIHRRMKALNECGHADWLKCEVCKKYDEPSNMFISYRNGCMDHKIHKTCHRR
jgi:hypothetical protein